MTSSKPCLAMSSGLPLASFIMRSARKREASTNCGSFMVTKAWSGVFILGRLTVQTSRVGASKSTMLGGGALRFQ